jgi:hypothetical protein
MTATASSGASPSAPEAAALGDEPADRPGETGRYEIRVKGHVDGRWAAWFDGMRLTNEDDGTTVIRGEVADQAALHGLLQKVRDVGLPLISVVAARPQ